MKDPVKIGAAILLGAVAIAIIAAIVKFLSSVLVPLALIAGAGILLIGLFSRKSLGGGRGRLP
jgi:hypothetical protein